MSSIVAVANETNLHVNTVSKYKKALSEAGIQFPAQHDDAVKLIETIIAKADETGESAYKIIAAMSNTPKPVGQKSAAQTTATAAAIEERLNIVSRQLQAILEKVETDTDETNEMLVDFERRLGNAEQKAELALSVARTAIDALHRHNDSEKIAEALSNGLFDILRFMSANGRDKIDGQPAPDSE